MRADRVQLRVSVHGGPGNDLSLRRIKGEYGYSMYLAIRGGAGFSPVSSQSTDLPHSLLILNKISGPISLSPRSAEER